jgi:hypothetical protein
VPLELAFRWGGTRTVNLRDRRNRRDPSTSMYKFPRLFGGLESHLNHATMVRVASFLVGRCAESCGVSPREFEAALFMWGYKVATTG